MSDHFSALRPDQLIAQFFKNWRYTMHLDIIRNSELYYSQQQKIFSNNASSSSTSTLCASEPCQYKNRDSGVPRPHGFIEGRCPPTVPTRCNLLCPSSFRSGSVCCDTIRRACRREHTVSSTATFHLERRDLCSIEFSNVPLLVMVINTPAHIRRISSPRPRCTLSHYW